MYVEHNYLCVSRMNIHMLSELYNIFRMNIHQNNYVFQFKLIEYLFEIIEFIVG